MRKWIFCALLIAATLPAFAARPVTVEQLEQILAAQKSAHKGDVESAKQIGSLELTEQLTPLKLDEVIANWRPGVKTAEVLGMLADASAALAPPPSEIPSVAKPDIATQRAMMSAAIQYVSATLRHLPDFLATRVTRSFDDSPTVVGHSGFAPHAEMHLVGTFNRTVTYRNGWEVLDSTASGSKHGGAVGPEGMSTWGEFGPVLGIILTDAVKGKLMWSRWERTAFGQAAVFHFAIPQEASHYIVDFCCVWKALSAGGPNSGNQVNADADFNNEQISYHGTPAYHGDLYVDPMTGSILRVALEAELKETNVITRAAIVVQYGKVDIGGSTFLCPVHSVAISVDQNRAGTAIGGETQVTRINETSFTDYHRFGSTARIVASAAGSQAAGASESESTSKEESNVPSAAAANGAQISASPVKESVPVEALAAEPAPAAGVESAQPVTQPMETLHNEPPATTGLVMRTMTRLVNVDVVAFDKKGHPVTDLKADDFEIFDNDREQRIKFFTPTGEGGGIEVAAPAVRETDEPGSPGGSHAGVGAIGGSTTILMIDARDMGFEDLSRVRQEVLRFLKNLPGSDRVGLYIMKSDGLQVLTEPKVDHARVAEALSKWMPSAQELAQAEEEERRSRQQFDTVQRPNDLAQVNGNASSAQELFAPLEGATQGTVDVASPLPGDPNLQRLHENPERTALLILENAARHLSAIPGHKSLVWIASDQVLADWNNHPATTEKGSKALDPHAVQTQEALNDAHVSVYPLDASRLETGDIGADLRTRNVEAIGYTARSRMDADQGSGLNPGRQTAQMQQDLHPIQGVFREVAEATGGRTLRRAGDLAGELEGVAAEGRAAYLLSFTPDMPADGIQHRLVVKLTHQRDVDLRYRTSYLYNY